MTAPVISTNDAVSDFELDLEVAVSRVQVSYWHFNSWVVSFEIELDGQRSYVQWIANSEDGEAVLERVEHSNERYDYHGDAFYRDRTTIMYDPTYVSLHKFLRLLDPKRIDFYGR